MESRRRTRGLALAAAIGAPLLLTLVAAPVAAKPAPFTSTTIVSVDEANCVFTVRYDWSGFTGKRLLAEIVLYELENGIDRPFAGHDAFIVEGRDGSFTWEFHVGFSSPEPARPIFATGELWTYNQNTKYVEGSRSFSDSVVTDCDF